MPQYQIVNGTSYHVETPAAVIEVLERARQNRTRIHISYGDSATGKDWLEEFDAHGYAARSMGPIKVPLLIANRRSTGGGAMLDHCMAVESCTSTRPTTLAISPFVRRPNPSRSPMAAR